MELIKALLLLAATFGSFYFAIVFGLYLAAGIERTWLKLTRAGGQVMELEEGRCKHSGVVLIFPVDDSSPTAKAIFRHCSEGMIAVTEEHYRHFTYPLLLLHGQKPVMKKMEAEEEVSS